MTRLLSATLVAAFAATVLSAPALAEHGVSAMQIGADGSQVVLDAAATVTPHVDACPNLDGIQDTVPAHMTLDPHGNCIHEAHSPTTTPTPAPTSTASKTPSPPT